MQKLLKKQVIGLCLSMNAQSPYQEIGEIPYIH